MIVRGKRIPRWLDYLDVAEIEHDCHIVMVKPKRPKPRRCRNRECRQPFVPTRPLQAACSPLCAIKLAEKKCDQTQQAEKKAERAAIKVRKEKLKTRRDWINEAQKEFNAFIRDRDYGERCISSGKPMDWAGNGVDAGHYRSIGSAPHLRFDERNCHAQSKQDNRYLSGNAVDYRIGLIARIGKQAVEALEADNTPRKWSIAELKAIRDLYRAKLKELKDTDNRF